MEGPSELVARIEGDVDKVMAMYVLAEKLYPYSNLTGERQDNDNKQRQAAQRFANETPEAVLGQGSGMSFLFVYMMSRAGAKGMFDMS